MADEGTYSGNPLSSPLDEVRYLIGDTFSSGKWEMSDAEIHYNIFIASGNNPPATGNYLAALHCVQGIAARYKSVVDKGVGDLHITHSQKQQNYQVLIERLRALAAFKHVPVYAGGLSRAEKNAQAQDTDLLSTAIKVDGMSEVVTPIRRSEETE